MSKNLVGLATCASTLLMACGCGSSPYDLVPVAGTVKLDGKPLGGAVVNFQPKSGGSANVGPGSNGRTDEAGHYELNTINDEAGAVVGSHRVRIYSYSPESPSVEDTDSGQALERVPERYNYRSELTYKVPAEGSNQANFDLTLP
jgi:hypothetical protein